MASVINILTVVGTALLSVRLYSSHLHLRYRAFFLFLIFFTLQNVALAVIGPKPGLYQKVWVLSEPIAWVFDVWVVLEVYSLVLQDYRGLSTVGRWFLVIGIVVALLASGFSLIVPSRYTTQGHLMTYYYVAERAVYFSLVVFLLTILALLLRYPITLNRNTVVHSVIFSVYFLGNTAIFLMLSTHGSGMLPTATHAIQAVNVGALAVWLALLNPAGEQRRQRLHPAWMPGREETLVKQLNSLNVALLRAAHLDCT